VTSLDPEVELQNQQTDGPINEQEQQHSVFINSKVRCAVEYQSRLAELGKKSREEAK